MKQYNITGLNCAACSARVEKAVSQVPGVISCSVNLLTKTMGVEGDVNPKVIIDTVVDAGYGASEIISIKKQDDEIDNRVPKHEDTLIDRETSQIRKRFFISVILLFPLMYISMGHMMWNFPLPNFLSNNHIAMGLIQLLLTTGIMVVNRHYFIGGFNSLFHRSPNMDTLVALGASASFGYSVYALFAMTSKDLYFETAAMILTLITLGKMLEARQKGKTTDALKGLMKLAPKSARIQKDGLEVEIPIEDVRIGDRFVVRPGENIPVDGVVLEGSSAVNEAALTGESIPVDKKANDEVFTATLNQSGFLICEARKVGEDTTLAQIIQLVSDAAATKAPISKVADRVSGIFVPVVIAIAFITILVWLFSGQTVGYALARGIAVLVISCPCALGLATPVAIMVGNGVGAKHGIMFKTAISLEETGKSSIVVLDKTGTITKGEPRVTDVLTCDAKDESELLSIAYALEKKSEHPLAKAIVVYAEKRDIKSQDISEFTAMPGNGLTGIQNGKMLSGGNLKFISEKTSVPDSFREKTIQISEEGKTPLFFCEDGRLLGVIAVADVLKEDSSTAVKELQKMGIHVVMLTGDNERSAKAIGKQVHVDEVIAGVLPEGKEAAISKLKEKGKVIMVGDGINDAPALMRADVGVAIGAGTDIAIDAADVVLMKSRLKDVVTAIKLSRATLKNIYENLFWAFIYNIIGIPLAAGVFINVFGWTLNPMFGAAAMSLSSVCVVSNALRLNLFKKF